MDHLRGTMLSNCLDNPQRPQVEAPTTGCTIWIGRVMDNGHPERAFFKKFETFGLGQINWAEILGGILAISSQTIGTVLGL